MKDTDRSLLVVTRKIGQSFTIGDDIIVCVSGRVGNQIKISVEAPRSVKIERNDGTNENLVKKNNYKREERRRINFANKNKNLAQKKDKELIATMSKIFQEDEKDGNAITVGDLQDNK